MAQTTIPRECPCLSSVGTCSSISRIVRMFLGPSRLACDRGDDAVRLRSSRASPWLTATMSPPDASPSSSNALISGATENADANAGAPPSLTSLAPPAARVTVFLTRHGESEYNLEGRVGGDSGLSAMGQVYAGRLPGTLQTVGNSGARSCPF